MDVVGQDASGIVHLSRKILQSDVWREMNPNRAKVWITLLCIVSPVDQTVRVMGRDYRIKPGEAVVVEQALADEVGLSLATLRAALTDLASDGGRVVITRGLKKGRVKIQVVNYARYQTPCIAPSTSEHVDGDSSGVPDNDGGLDGWSGRGGTRKPRSERIGAITWMESLREVAKERSREIGERIRSSGADRETDLNKRASRYRACAGEIWNGARLWEWLGLYDVKYESTFGVRSAEIVSASKKDLTSRVSVIGAMMRVFRTWARNGESAEGMMFDYIRWRFAGERRKNKRVVEHGGKLRNPITLESCFDPKELNKWYASVESIRT